MLSRDCFPEKMRKAPWSAQIRLDDKRLTSSTSLAICCMDTFVSFPSEQFEVMYDFRDRLKIFYAPAMTCITLLSITFTLSSTATLSLTSATWSWIDAI